MSPASGGQGLSDRVAGAMRGRGGSADHDQIGMDFSGDPQESGNGVAKSMNEGDIEVGRLAQHPGSQVLVPFADSRIRHP